MLTVWIKSSSFVSNLHLFQISIFNRDRGLHTLGVLYTDIFLQSYECFILLKGNCHFFFF